MKHPHAPYQRRLNTGAVLAVTMEACHGLGDMWVQTTKQATLKGSHGANRATGRKACAAHCATYTATHALGILAANRLLNLRLNPRRVATALAVAGLSHYVIDRREPLRKLAAALHKEDFYHQQAPVPGAFHLDQAAHRAFNTLAAFIAATPAP